MSARNVHSPHPNYFESVRVETCNGSADQTNQVSRTHIAFSRVRLSNRAHASEPASPQHSGNRRRRTHQPGMHSGENEQRRVGVIQKKRDVGRADCNFCQFSLHYTATTLGSDHIEFLTHGLLERRRA
jgi:hypothetical protein